MTKRKKRRAQPREPPLIVSVPYKMPYLIEDCPKCGGRGWLAPVSLYLRETCPSCEGLGTVIWKDNRPKK